EAVLDDLLAQCQSQGDMPVMVNEVAVNVAAGCAALAQWDGYYNLNSRAAHLFREFAEQFASDPQWVEEFDPARPLTTPNGLLANTVTLQHFAQAILDVQAAGLALD